MSDSAGGGHAPEHTLKFLGAKLVKRFTLLGRPSVHHLIHVQLALGKLDDALLDRLARDEAVHVHLLVLADAVHPRHCLNVALRVPV